NDAYIRNHEHDALGIMRTSFHNSFRCEAGEPYYPIIIAACVALCDRLEDIFPPWQGTLTGMIVSTFLSIVAMATYSCCVSPLQQQKYQTEKNLLCAKRKLDQMKEEKIILENEIAQLEQN